MNCFEDCSGSAGLTAFLSVSLKLPEPVSRFFAVPMKSILTASIF